MSYLSPDDLDFCFVWGFRVLGYDLFENAREVFHILV